MQTKPDILSILNSNQHQPMIPQNIRDSIASDSSSMISTVNYPPINRQACKSLS